MLVNFIHKNKLLLIFLTIGIIWTVIAQVPMLLLANRAPPNTTFTFDPQTRTAMDYPVYLSAITQGSHGAWFMQNSFGPEPSNPTSFYFFYVLLGKLTGFIGLESYIVFHSTRFLFTIIFFLAIFKLSTFVLGKKAGFWANVFAITATTMPKFIYNEHPQGFIEYVPWWAFFESLKRLESAPHYLAGYSLLLITVYQVFAHIKDSKPSRILFLAASTIFAGLFLPSSLIPLLFALPASFVTHSIINSIKNKRLVIDKKLIAPFLAVMISGIVILGIVKLEELNGFPWNTWNKDEVARWNKGTPLVNMQMVYTFGILFFISLPVIIHAWMKRSFIMIFVWFWAFAPFLLNPLTPIFQVASIRLLNGAPYVPFSLLSIYLIFKILPVKKAYIKSLIAFSIVIFTFIPASYEQLKIHIDFNQNKQMIYTNHFIPQPAWNIFIYISKNIPKNSVIMGDWFTSNILPAYAPVKTYVGHTLLTQNFFEKKYLSERFYSNNLSEEGALNILKASNITYVYYGSGEQRYAGSLKYTFLEPVYEDGGYVLYEVISNKK
ncbi:hypothetical protein ACFL1A_03045 [Patescibacteria group bacterium]